MPETILAAGGPLAHCLTPGRHGRSAGDAGVRLSVLADIDLFMLLGRKADGEALRAAAAAAGTALPGAGKATGAGRDVAILWSGPDQWLVVADPAGRAQARQLIDTCRNSATVIDASDGRAVLAVAGPNARKTLAKSLPIDLHPRGFQPGSTALTLAAGVAVQIWQVDDAPTYRIAVHRSFAETFWRWLVEAAAEFGVEVLIDQPR